MKYNAYVIFCVTKQPNYIHCYHARYLCCDYMEFKAHNWILGAFV